MLIITSIMNNGNKSDLLNQAGAVATWIDMGFHVVSVNTREELRELKLTFPGVEFLEPETTGLLQYGKPIPYIYDMFQILKEKSRREDEICGIVNSDIYLRNMKGKDLEQIFQCDSEKIICMHRYDIKNSEDLDGEYYFSGIDAFFMQKRTLCIFEKSDYALGKPEWDHWVVETAFRNQIVVYEIKNAVAFHVKHRQRWTSAESNAIGRRGTANTLGEQYYAVTNRELEKLSNRILIGAKDTQQALFIEKRKEMYFESDLQKLAGIELERHQADAALFPLGIGYYEGDVFYRISALHGTLYQNSVCVYKQGKEISGAVKLGEIVAYVDFMQTELASQLDRFYIYPAGRAGRMLLDCLLWNNKKPLGLVDKDANLQETQYKGVNIYAPEVLKKSSAYDQVLLISNLYVSEIFQELSKVVPYEKLIII